MARPKVRNLSGETDNLESLIKDALDTAAKAKKQRANLAGRNHYADKFAKLRREVTEVFQEMKPTSAGETTALAEMLDSIFAPDTVPKKRTEISREFLYKVATTKHLRKMSKGKIDDQQFFPLSILTSTKRSYLERIGSEINGSFANRLYACCAVMMRRLLEVIIIESFENNAIAARIKDSNGNYFLLEELVNKALGETGWTLTRNTKNYLPQLREFGNLSSHGRYYHPRIEDIDRLRTPFRICIEEMLHHAKLL